MTRQVRRNVIALDLEGTLISNAMSQIPRPGLYSFLESCRGLTPHIVLFTFVRTALVVQIVEQLVADGFAPEWFRQTECIEWTGATKNLAFIPDCDVESAVLVDDLSGYVHPGQESHWLPVPSFSAPYPPDDRALDDVALALRSRLGAQES